MIFEKTMQTMKDFDSVIQAANETFRTAKKTALETYKEPMATQKLREARDVLTEVKTRETQNARAAVMADFAAVRGKVNEVVTAAVPADFPATLAAIQAKGKNVSDYEAEAFSEKYKGNYMAFTTILDVLHNAGKASSRIAYKPDAIEYQIEEIERTVLHWVQTHADSNTDGYMTALLTSDEHSLVMKLAAEVQAFLDGGYTLGADDAEQLAAAIAAQNAQANA